MGIWPLPAFGELSQTLEVFLARVSGTEHNEQHRTLWAWVGKGMHGFLGDERGCPGLGCDRLVSYDELDLALDDVEDFRHLVVNMAPWPLSPGLHRILEQPEMAGRVFTADFEGTTGAGPDAELAALSALEYNCRLGKRHRILLILAGGYTVDLVGISR